MVERAPEKRKFEALEQGSLKQESIFHPKLSWGVLLGEISEYGNSTKENKSRKVMEEINEHQLRSHAVNGFVSRNDKIRPVSHIVPQTEV
jgi:hypothetical protein